jgi:hypothetical protein
LVAQVEESEKTRMSKSMHKATSNRCPGSLLESDSKAGRTNVGIRVQEDVSLALRANIKPRSLAIKSAFITWVQFAEVHWKRRFKVRVPRPDFGVQ